LTGINGGGGFGTEETDDVEPEFRFDVGTGNPGLGEAPVLLRECGLLPGTTPVNGDWLVEYGDLLIKLDDDVPCEGLIESEWIPLVRRRLSSVDWADTCDPAAVVRDCINSEL